MTDTATAQVAASPAPKMRRSATRFDANPAKAGWFTKSVLIVLCLLWLIPLIGTLIT